MNRKMVNTDRVVLWSVIAVLVVFVLACDSETLVGLVGNSKPLTANITEPTTGTQVEANESLALVVSATDSKGVNRIEFWADGTLYSSQNNPLADGSTSFVAKESWSSDVAGQHILLARAYNSKGQVSPDDTVTIIVREGEPTQTPISAPTPTSVALIVSTVTPAPAQVKSAGPIQRPATCGPITSFNDFGTWKRGDEPYGTFTQTAAQAYATGQSGKLSYNFPTGGNDYVVFQKTYPLGGHGNQIRAWVYGDGGGHFLNAWIQDAGGEIWQFSFGQVKHTGWQQMTAHLGPEQPWPSGHVSGPANGAVDYPIDFRALILDDAPDTHSGSGVIYVDELSCAEGPPQGSPVNFWADAESVNACACTKLHWAVDNVREVYLDGGGVAGHGERQVCPSQDTTYSLHVVNLDGTTADKSVTVRTVGNCGSAAQPPKADLPGENIITDVGVVPTIDISKFLPTEEPPGIITDVGVVPTVDISKFLTP